MTDVLKITQKDTNRIKRLKQVTGADDRYINYNYPGANEAYQRSIDAAKRLTEQGIKASPINPRDEAKANIKEMQQGGALSPLPRGKHQVGVYLNWGDWKPGGPSVKELVNQLKIQNAKISGSFLREILGPFQRGEPDQGRDYFKLQQKKRDTFGPQDKRKIA